jgi:hypothetical protein
VTVRFQSLFLASSACIALLMPVAPAVAQDQSIDPEDEIVVTADRFFGGVVATEPPLVTLNEDEIASYGASSLADLLQAISTTTGSGRGRGGGGMPVVLVNGQRVSGFRELRSYPPESINRVEVLPEEVARKYGFPPDQRVVNFILKDNFQSREVEAEMGLPGSGGYSTQEADLTYLKIDGANRLNLDLEVKYSSMLTEAERGVVQQLRSDVAADPDPARYRSLVDDSKDITFNGTWSKGVGDAGGIFSINATAQRSDNLTLRGLDTVVLTGPGGASALRTLNPDDPLARDKRVTSLSLATTYDRPIGDGWRITATGDAHHTRTRTLTDRRSDVSGFQALAATGALPLDAPLPTLGTDGGQDRALSRASSLTSLVTLIGSPLRLPAGDLSATFKLGYDWDGVKSSDTRNAGASSNLKRGDLSLGGDFSVPLTSRRENVLSGVGDVTLSLGGGARRLSDFGTLGNWNAGLTWKPADKLALTATYIWRKEPPSLANLGDPEIVLLNEPLYDFARGQTVLATVTTGGNAQLKAETQRDWKLSVNWQLPVKQDASLIVEYFRNTSSNVTAQFPLLTPAIEASFPGRVTRDGFGNLTALDRRPITLASQSWKRLRYGVEVNGKLGKTPPPKAGGGGGAPDPRSMMRGGRGGRWMLSAYHTVEFENRVRLSSGGPVLDLLGGDALTSAPAPRHKVEAQLGFFTGGIGGRITGKYQSAATVGDGVDRLRFGSLTTLDAGLFVDLGQPGLISKEPGVLKNARIFFRVENLFDKRIRVRDASGATPLSYQPDLIDPVGRLFRIELRKIF